MLKLVITNFHAMSTENIIHYVVYILQAGAVLRGDRIRADTPIVSK